MSKGYQQHKERLQIVASFGRDLARRSGSKCELCGAAGVKLLTYEVPPVPDEPEFDHCLFACETCATQIENPKRMEADHWRCLYDTAWSDIPAVQVTAVRLLRQLAEQEPWASDLLEQLYLSPAVEEWLAA